MKYPPFCDIIVVSFNGADEKEIVNISNFVYDYLKKNLDENHYKVLKPMPSPIDKIQNKIRWRLIIKGIMTINANTIFNDCLKQIYEKNLKQTRISISVNPNSMI